ncbi:hypothetical protein ARSEF1564_009868, partial [Beauveria bassiana]
MTHQIPKHSQPAHQLFITPRQLATHKQMCVCKQLCIQQTRSLCAEKPLCLAEKRCQSRKRFFRSPKKLLYINAARLVACCYEYFRRGGCAE